MKRLSTLFAIVLIALALWQCASEKGTTIKGSIPDAANLQVFLDQVIIGKASNVIGKGEIDASGNFALSFSEGIQPGIYNLRIGAKRMNLILDGSEKTVNLNGNLDQFSNYQIGLSGSPSSTILADIMRKLMMRQLTIADIDVFVDSVSNPVLGAFVAYRALGPSGVETQKKAQQKLAAAFPNSELAMNYLNFITVVERQNAATMATSLIQVGQPAPDIRLPNPNGKEYSLSDLKGKVVLLDFWASWCGPCRRENPNVVNVYKKYKDKGFTVFSVSLDGLDGSTMARLSSQDQVDQMMERSKERWVEAIKQDGLIWEYHVSDLKKWDSAPAAIYGVRGIPRTFLVDREGKIVATDLRGAAQIEQELLKHI